MNENIKQRAETVPTGISRVQLIINNRGEVTDYIFVEMDLVFSKMTGWSREEIIDKKSGDVFGLTNSNREYWLLLFARVFALNKTYERTLWSEKGQKYLRFSIKPLEGDQLILVAQLADQGDIAFARNEELYKNMEAIEVIFNSSHDALSLIEYQDGRYVYVRNNLHHQNWTGVRNIGGIAVADLVGHETGEFLKARYDQCVRTGRPVRYEQEYTFPSGKRIWQTEVTPIFGREGIQYLLCFSKDITEVKKIEDENKRLALRLKAMFNQHSAIKLIFDPATEKIVDVNPAACAFYGYSREELLKMKIGALNMLPPERLGATFHEELTGNNYFPALPYRLKSGEIRLLDVYSCPIEEDGRVLLYDLIMDTTDREMYRSQLQQEKELLKITLQSIGDGVVTTDSAGKITTLNRVAQELTGWDESAVGKMFTEVFVLQNEETGKPVENPIQGVLDTGRAVTLADNTELIARHGHRVPIADSAAPIQSEDGKMVGVVMVFRDVIEERAQRKQIEFLSYHDPLTGLRNRHYVEENLHRLDTEKNLPISVMMGDVNGLKITNDVFGHKAGDILLQNVAELLQKYCREQDLIARWGGDEFVVFMPRTPLKEAEKIIEKINKARVAVNESGLNLSVSLGCSVKTQPEKGMEAVIKEAEEYMYNRKLLEGKSYRNAIINTLLAALYEKSSETEDHSRRLEQHSLAIGRELGLSPKELDDLSLLSYLHDIGKVAIDVTILQKAGPLTFKEWNELMRHPEIGYRIAQTTPELTAIADLILTHHERWDGKGYPQGLKGDETPLAARIIAVADAFDAMTNERAYRRTLSIEEALRELEDNAGTQFDPKIAKILIKHIRAEQKPDGNV